MCGLHGRRRPGWPINAAVRSTRDHPLLPPFQEKGSVILNWLIQLDFRMLRPLASEILQPLFFMGDAPQAAVTRDNFVGGEDDLFDIVPNRACLAPLAHPTGTSRFHRGGSPLRRVGSGRSRLGHPLHPCALK